MKYIQTSTIINPLQNKYLTPKRLEKCGTGLIISSSIIAFLGYILTQSKCGCVPSIQGCLDSVQCILSFFVILFSGLCSYFHIVSEDERKRVAVDNAYNMHYGESESVDYYTNDNVKQGLERLSTNMFESCFFTNKIAGVMLTHSLAKSLLLLIPFVITIFLADSKMIVLLANLAIVSLILADCAKLIALFLRTKSILTRYRAFYCSRKSMNQHARNSQMQLLILEYESALSWSHVLLDEGVYTKLNNKLSKEWEEIKKQYGISEN